MYISFFDMISPTMEQNRSQMCHFSHEGYSQNNKNVREEDKMIDKIISFILFKPDYISYLQALQKLFVIVTIDLQNVLHL